jgi:signal transduction histidine kinase
MTNRDPRYIAANLVNGAFESLRVDAFALADTGGQVVAGAAMAGDEFRMNWLPPDFEQLVDSPNGVLERIGQESLAGFAVTGNGIWMVGAAPILNSRDEGPSRGALIMGRRIGEREQERLLRLIGPSFGLIPAAQDWPPGKVDVAAISPSILQTRVAIADVFGTGRLAMELHFPRTVYAQVGTALSYLALWIIAVGAGVWLLSGGLLDRWVLRSVTESVSAIRRGLTAPRPTGGARLPLKRLRNDEIGELVDAIEAAISAVEVSAREADRRRTEAIHSQRLAALGTIAAGVAHEVNNPNGVISLNLNVLRRELGRLFAMLKARDRDASTDGATMDDLAQVEKELEGAVGECLLASERIAGIVSSLKSFARPTELAEKESVALPDLVEEAARWLRHEYNGARCRLEKTVAQDLPRVSANKQQLLQVFVNLLQNACQAATQPDSIVRVSVSRAIEKGAIEVAVADEGRGMPPEDVERALDPFFTTRRAEGGTGLGLSISAAIVKAHGGSLRVESREAAGTVATVTLPVDEGGGHVE